MNADSVLLAITCFVVGVAFGCWRTMVYARKLIHFGVSLDEWAHYDEYTEQAVDDDDDK